MNYYNFHIGDYARRTRHLSVIEDLFYRRLLDLYYTTEAPLPDNLTQLYRLLQASEPPYRDAVECVLREFFELTEQGWINRRADDEILTMREKQQKQRDRANKRWQQSGAKTAADAETVTGSAVATTESADGNAGDTHAAMPRHEQRDATASDIDAVAMPPTPTPIPTPTPKVNTRRQRVNALSPPADVPEAVWRDFLAIRAAKRSPLTETALANIEREARSAGVSLTTALETCCANGWAGFQADWYAKRNTSGQKPRAPHAHFNRQVALEESNRAIARSFNEEMDRRNAAKHN